MTSRLSRCWRGILGGAKSPSKPARSGCDQLRRGRRHHRLVPSSGLIAWLRAGTEIPRGLLSLDWAPTMIVMTLLFASPRTVFRPKSGNVAGTLALRVASSVLSAWTTETNRIHALFGAFLAGVILPRSKSFSRSLTATWTITSVLLLPLFFAFTGFADERSLLEWGHVLVLCALIVPGRRPGKLFGCAVAGRVSGMIGTTPFRSAY